MIIIKKARQLTDFLFKKRSEMARIGFVPTMGALHEGHITLIKRSIEVDEITVCSIFVNPTQFNNPDDFEKYPVTIEEDIYMLESTGCSILFLPGVNEIYPKGIQQLSNYDLGYLETVLEGEFRPGHFQGVCQVVDRLLYIVGPDILYLGQKDYQQCLVIKHLLFLNGLNEKLRIEISPTIREPEGLAMSSRNKRLSKEARLISSSISKTLLFIKDNCKEGNTGEILSQAAMKLELSGFKIDYLRIADAETLELKTEWDGKLKIVVLAAVYIEDIRLIDNMLIN